MSNPIKGAKDLKRHFTKKLYSWQIRYEKMLIMILATCRLKCDTTTNLLSAVLSCSVMSSSLQPHGLQPDRLLCPWGFSRQEYWSGLPRPLPGDLPNSGISLGLPHCRQILCHLSHQGSPRVLEWAAYPFSRGTFQPRTRTRVSRIAGKFFTS